VRESADDMYVAIDQAARKLERQARRYRDRRKDHHGRPPADEVSEAAGAPPSAAAPARPAATEPAEPTPRLVKSKSFELKPMNPEEAALFMDLVHHDFYVFLNEGDGLVNVVYRRRDGDFGLIAPGS
jgi:putative sigma-54 modulation protein